MTAVALDLHALIREPHGVASRAVEEQERKHFNTKLDDAYRLYREAWLDALQDQGANSVRYVRAERGLARWQAVEECDDCEGEGELETKSGRLVECPGCQGDGISEYLDYFMTDMEVTCIMEADALPDWRRDGEAPTRPTTLSLWPAK